MDSSGPRTRRLPLPCHYVSLDSDDEVFASEQLRQAVSLQPEFARRGFALSTSFRLPDIRVHLRIVTGVVRERTILLQAWDTRSQTTTQENLAWPKTDHQRVIAAKVMVMLSKLCGELRTPKLQQELSHEEVAERLASFHHVQAISRTYFAPKRMIVELSAREEIAEWGITISTSPESADVALSIDHLPSISWGYRLVDLKDGELLDSGSVYAFQEERAASRIADTLIIHLAECRPLKPIRTIPTNRGEQGVSLDQFGSWNLTQIPDDSKSPPQRITLKAQAGTLIGITSDEQTAFSIGINRILDVALDDTAYVRLDELPGVMDEYGLLYWVKIPKYRIHIAWNAGNVTRQVSLQASKGKLKELFARLSAVVNSHGVVSDIR